MNNWTLGSFLFWLAVAILVPAVVVHFALGRKGGHRLFDKDNLSADEVRKLPLEMLKRRTIWNLKGSAAVIVGLVIALALYPVGCLVGLPINIFGLSDEKLIFYTAGAIVLLVTLGPTLYRKLRQE
jgi:hypothetical protein